MGNLFFASGNFVLELPGLIDEGAGSYGVQGHVYGQGHLYLLSEQRKDVRFLVFFPT
jgi:hypothetical protein